MRHFRADFGTHWLGLSEAKPERFWLKSSQAREPLAWFGLIISFFVWSSQGRPEVCFIEAIILPDLSVECFYKIHNANIGALNNQERSNITESLSEKNSVKLGTLGNIGTFGDEDRNKSLLKIKKRRSEFCRNKPVIFDPCRIIFCMAFNFISFDKFLYHKNTR